ncbi:MAG: hypothetical protein Q9168_002207 [Polycauliona sp. 1 TL-2023]
MEDQTRFVFDDDREEPFSSEFWQYDITPIVDAPTASHPFKHTTYTDQRDKLLSDFSSQKCVARVREWLQKCGSEHTHSSCRRPAATPLPKRVIDVALDRDVERCRLFEPEDEIYAPYLALSHCWGTQVKFTVTSKNIEGAKIQLPFHMLPKTFRDSILLARELEIKYLWIDSLCIIQDSSADWETESGNMGDIYANAYATICASSAAGDDVGFFVPRPDTTCGKLVSYDEDAPSADLRVRRIPRHYRSLKGIAFLGTKPMPEEGPSITRAWATQEQILSRRVIYYCVDEIAFECNSLLACECGSLEELTGPDGPRDAHIMFDVSWDEPQYRRLFLDQQSPADLYTQWRGLLVHYTAKKLTKATDILPALSGIASKIQQSSGDIYLAGLWKNDLRAGLLWRLHSDAVGALPTVYRGPTFSWVSVEGSISHPSDDFPEEVWQESTFKVLDARCVVQGKNSFGLVESGYLRLRGLVHDTTMILEEDFYKIGLAKHAKEVDFRSDCCCLSRIPVTHSTGDQVWTVTRSSVHDDSLLEETHVIALIVGRIPKFYKERAMFYLLLLGLSPTVAGAYERIGILELGFRPQYAARWLSQFKEAEITIV